MAKKEKELVSLHVADINGDDYRTVLELYTLAKFVRKCFKDKADEIRKQKK